MGGKLPTFPGSLAPPAWHGAPGQNDAMAHEQNMQAERGWAAGGDGALRRGQGSCPGWSSHGRTWLAAAYLDNQPWP